MQTNSVNFGTKDKNNLPANQVIGIGMGAFVGTLYPYLALKSVITPLSEKEKSLIARFHCKSMPDVDTFSSIESAIQDAIVKTDLKNKGVKLFIANENSVAELKRIMESVSKKNSFNQKLIKYYLDVLSNGLNASYLIEAKNIVINDKQLFSSAFHELGHALNFNKEGIINILIKGRKLTPHSIPILGLGFLAVGLLHKNKPQSEDKSSFEKTKDFIKNNAGKLTFMTFLPKLIDEAAASINGIKISKNYLKPDQVERLTKNYKHAFSTYARTAVFSSLFIFLGIKVKDEIAKN